MTKMIETKRILGARITESAIRHLKHLAIDLDKPIWALLEEAIQDLLKKYQTKPQAKKKS